MKKFILAILSGLLLALSWPTYGFPFLLFVAFVPLLLLEHEYFLNKTIKHTFWKVFGFSYLTFLLWNYVSTQWLHYSQRPDGSLAWEAFLFPLFANSFLMSLTFSIFHWTKKKIGSQLGLIFFPALWIAFEKFHLSWEISWPWLNLGNAFADYPKTIQWYEYTGTFGGTLWVLIVNEIIFYYVKAYQVTKSKIYLWRPIFYSILIIGIPIVLSIFIYSSYQEKSEQELEVVATQPKLDPYSEKYSLNGTEITENILRVANGAISPKTAFIVAPETAFPGRDDIDIKNINNDIYIQQIKRWMKEKQNPALDFTSGASLIQFYDSEKTESARFIPQLNQYIDVYNSAVQLNDTKNIDIYHKSKLVVGVEHFPYSSILKPLIGNVMLNFGGTMATLGMQKERSVFSNPYNKAKVAPIICYESIYGEYVTEYLKKGANVLFIMTNDSWWSDSQGHKQLLAYAKLRAIENRRDIARSANSGISAFINQKGDIVKELPYDISGALKGNIHLNSQLTFYSKYGDLIARFSLLAVGLLFGYALTKLFQKKKP